MKITFTTVGPDGGAAVATAHVNRQSRTATAEGLDRVSAILSKSHDAQLLVTLLPPLLAANPRAAGCLADAGGVFVAGAGAAIACAELNPLCLVAVLALADQMGAMLEDCGGPYYEDTTGWG